MNSKRKLTDIIGGREAREILGVSDAYLYNVIIKQNKIPRHRISSGWIFFREDVMRFKHERRKKAKTDKRVRLK